GIAGDRSGGNAHAAFVGGVYWTEESAPLNACAETDTEGNYTVADLRYGDGTSFTLTPALGVRQFDPAFKTITLSANSPVQNEVDFIDVSAFSASGLVQFEGTTCPVPGTNIYVDGDFRGQTESDGTYNVSVDIGERIVEVQKGEAGDEHAFNPPSRTITVESNVFGVDFTDGKTRTLSGFFGGSCNTAIGTATIKIFTADGCFEKIIETDANYEVELPPQKYLVQVTNVETTNAALKADIIEFFDTLGAQEVDLTEAADTLDLIYHAPLSVAVSGFLDAPSTLVEDAEALCPAGITKPDGGVIEPVPVLIQPNGEPGYIPLTISVFEDFGDDGLCPADSGTVTVFDEIINMGDTPIEMDIIDGIAVYAEDQIDPITGDTLFVKGDLYRTRANSPNIAAGQTVDGVDRSFQKSLTAVAEVPGRAAVTETAWVLVDGALARTSTFATEPIDLPFYVLRDPPGDGSYSYLEKGSEFCSTTKGFAFFNLKTGSSNFTQAGVRFTKGLGVSFFTKAQVLANIENTLKVETKIGAGITVCTSSSERYQTSSSSTFIGAPADVFIGAGVNFDFSPTDVIAFDDAACRITKDEDISVDLNESNTWETTYVFTQNHVENTLIPQLEAAVEDLSDDDEIDRLNTAIENWQGYIDKNQEDKDDAEPIDQELSEGTLENVSFTAGSSFEFSYGDRTSGEGTLEIKITSKTAFEIGIVAEESGNGKDVKGILEFEKGGGFGQTLGGGESTTRGFVLADDDIGDFFSVDVKQGSTWDTPIFELKSGTSSGPWEEGTQKRDNPTLSLNPPELLDVPADQPAVFTLSLTNLSESKEAREYVLRTVSTSNPGGATLKAQGSSIQSGLSFFVDPDQTQEITLEVSRGPTKYNYDDLAVMVYPPGDFSVWSDGGSLLVADTVFFNVHYTAPCSEISILRPKENWIYNADMAEAGDSVEVILNDFVLQDADADPVESIGLEYRLVDTPDWLPALEVQASTLDPDADSYVAKWKPPADGLFEVRAFTSCPLGTTYSEPFPGVADTKRPVPFGTPQPADEALALGDDIAVTFDEDIDCATVSTDGQFPDATLTYLDGADAGATIPVEASCDGRTIILDPLADDADLEGRLLEARLLSGVVDGQGVPVVVSDLVGNGIGEDVAWAFTVRQSAFTFSPVNVDLEITRGTGAVAATSLVNGRAQPITFALPPTFDLTHEDGVTTVTLTPSVTAGTIVAGGAKTIQFTLPDTLALGAYEGTLMASGMDADGVDLGQTPFTLTADVVCEPPEWSVTPSNFQYSMALTAQLFFDGVASADTSDVLTAFVGDEVRGVGTVSESSPGVFRVDMLIYGNVLSGEVVTFKAWQNATCTLHEETSKTFVFESGAVQGTFAQPVNIEAPPPVEEQAVALAAGWTWFSLNAAPDDASVNAVLADVVGTEGDIVKSQTAFSLFDDDFGWVGTLPTIEPGPAYLINLRQSNSLSVSGTVVDPPSLPITLTPGWNWIGYLPQAALPINDALASLGATAVTDDLIKSQFAFAQYVGFGWVGSLTTMEPGLGYQIYTANGGTLTYPANTAAATTVAQSGAAVRPETATARPLPKARGLAEKEVRSDDPAPEMRGALERAEAKNDDAGAGPGWTVDPLAYPFSMTLTAVVERDGKPMRRPNLRVGFFAGDELRGVGRITYVEALKRSLVFALAYGEEETDLTVRVFDDAEGRVYDAGTIRFRPGAAMGSPLEPVRITAKDAGDGAVGLPETFALEPAYPNPFNPVTTLRYALPQAEHVTLEVFDMLGRRVATLVNEVQKAGRYTIRFEAGDLASGVYFYRMRAGSFVETHKMILLK
ncbi:T9SS type A sorting domain-containing protein, partial [Rhodocaloribacter sp.]